MCKIIWITGISGTGKTTLAKYYKRFLKKFIWIDGDEFRKLFNNDLGYTLKERNKNAERLINFAKFLNKQKISLIISANLTSDIYKKRVKKIFKNIFLIQIETKLNILKKRDKKLIYVRKINVVGKDIKIRQTFTGYDFLVYNNSTKKKFLYKGDIILKKIELK